ncbi:MAG: TolC family protein [Polyangia bacterium]
MTRVLSGLLAGVMLSVFAVLSPTRAHDTATRPPALLLHSKREAPRAELPKKPLTLESALAIALANNPDMVSDGWEIEAASARKRQAVSEHWPSLGVFAAYRHHWHEERLAPARGPQAPAVSSHDIFAGDVVLTIPLLSGGRVVRAVAAADLLSRAADEKLARTRDELIFNIKSTFYGILGQNKLIDAIEHSRKALFEHRKEILQLIEARKAARVDLLNIEVRLADLNHRLVKQRGMVELHERLLLSLLGVETMPPEGLTLDGSLSPPRSAPDRKKLLAAAARKRPDLSQIDLEIEAQARRVDMARAEYWPVVSAKGTYGSRLSVQGDYDDLGFVGLELAMPIFTGFRTPARVEEEQARLRILQQQKRKLLLTVRREVDSAVIQIETALAAVQATEKSIAMAEESLSITRDKAALGHGTATDVLDAQAALLRAETTYFAALADLHTAFALLELAAGGET